jgi:hypothetical protein
MDGPDLQAYFDGSKPIPTPEELEDQIHRNDDTAAPRSNGPDIVLQPGPS